MRLAVSLSLVCVLAAAGCTSSSGESLAADEGDRDEDDDSGGGGLGSPEGAECELAIDCVAAGSTCCECPTFAVSAASGYEEACADVSCDPAPTGCALTEPACNGGRCELVCVQVATEMSCADGFARDDFGCLIDVCADPGTSTAECDGDEDCVQVPADCCGCARGGSDTAVPAGTEDDYDDGLACPPDPSCPGVDVCDPDSEPRCIGGSCRLAAPPSDPGEDDQPSVLCGTADTPPCPDGQVCVLNHPDAGDATQLGAGSCQDP